MTSNPPGQVPAGSERAADAVDALPDGSTAAPPAGPFAESLTGTSHSRVQLPEGEDWFHAVWESAADAMALSDPQGVVLAANRAYLDLYGYTSEEVVGKSFSIIFPAEVRDWADSEYLRAFADQVISPSVETTIRRRDGSSRTVESRYTFLTRDGKRTAMISIVRDTTDRMRMEQRLRESEERFRLALSRSPVAVFNQDKDLRYTWIYNPNPAIPVDALIGHTDGEVFQADEASALTELKRSVLETGRSRRQEIVLTIGGGRFHYDLMAEPVRDNGGKIVGVTCAAIDITGRKQAEAERQQLLESEQQAHSQARQAVLMRDQVLSTVAHDLRNALTSIKGFAQLLSIRLQRHTDPLDQRSESQQSQYQGVLLGLEQIDDTVNRMNGLIGELMDTALLQIGQPLNLNRAPADLVGLVSAAVESVQQGSTGHTVRFDAAQPLLMGDWDTLRLRRVFDNLLGNAVKYSPDGSEVAVSLRREDGQALVEVKDNGIGIPAEDLPHIFDWFYRAGNAPEGVKGSGIGLAGSQNIVQQHGGTITVESQVGEGTRFTVRLPL